MPYQEVLPGEPPSGDSPNSGRIKWNENDEELFDRVDALENDPGTPGPAGEDGRTVLNGSGAPDSGLGIDGDFYIDTTADAIYGPKTGGAWGSATSLIGPQGPEGTVGSHNHDERYYTETEMDTALSGKQSTYEKGQANGYASLDSDGKVPSGQLPATSGGTTIPAGAMMMHAGSSAPSGWLVCNGTEVSRTTYADLYAALGGASSPWGQGNGTSTFNVPDLRGRAPIGVGTGSGLTARALAAQVGTENHTLTEAQMPAHTHTYNDYAGIGSQTSGGSFARGQTPNTASGSTGGGQSHPNMQPSVAVNFIIKT